MSFSRDQVYCVLDYETYSEADLKRVGAYEYSVHPSTEILCAAWRIGTRETLKTSKTQTWCASINRFENFEELRTIIDNPDIILVAHNALFEQVITRNVFFLKNTLDISPRRWICTASLAAALALPRKLEGAAKALSLPVQKDMEGNRLVLKWCKPKKPSQKDPSTRHSNSDELKRIVDYCATDVETTVELFLKCPPLSSQERKLWVLDQTINLRGFLVDRPLVTTILGMIEDETKVLNDETSDLTNGLFDSASQRDWVLRYLEAENIQLPDLRKKTVEDILSLNLVEGSGKRMLEIRQAVSKTSTAKYEAFELRSRHDSRLRDILLFHAASTGRWGGMGVQPQNFPRGTIKNTIAASEVLLTGDLELIRLIYGDPMSVFSSCLRNMIIAPEGKILDIADYAAVETRVLFWIAKHEKGLQAFRDGRDLYKEQAASIFNIPIEKVGSFERFVGKGVILGCGYSMGGKKFAGSCKSQGQEVSQELADAAVKSYRTVHRPVVKLWDNIARAAIAAIQNPGKKYTINKTSWFILNSFLYCELPSGRKLAYYKPHVTYSDTAWGQKHAVINHYGVNSLTKKWEIHKTYGGKLVENVVQAISRDLMAEAMLRIESKGPWQIVLSVHDELIAERDLKLSGTNKEFCNLMAELPDWAEDCPIQVEGFESRRYRK